MTDQPSLLVVEDDPAMLRALASALRARRYTVIPATTGAEALMRCLNDNPTMMLLDLGLPDRDGIDICRDIRQRSQLPIIVLTADGDENRMIEALDEGADDYITKPFSLPELLARIRVALRHHTLRGTPLESGVLIVGDLRVDLASHEATLAGANLDLSPKEFDLLTLLARYPGRLLSQRMILEQVWGEEQSHHTEYLRVYARRLRKKLGDTGGAQLITEAGVGYRLVGPGRESPSRGRCDREPDGMSGFSSWRASHEP